VRSAVLKYRRPAFSQKPTCTATRAAAGAPEQGLERLGRHLGLEELVEVGADPLGKVRVRAISG